MSPILCSQKVTLMSFFSRKGRFLDFLDQLHDSVLVRPIIFYVHTSLKTYIFLYGQIWVFHYLTAKLSFSIEPLVVSIDQWFYNLLLCFLHYQLIIYILCVNFHCVHSNIKNTPRSKMRGLISSACCKNQFCFQWKNPEHVLDRL